MQTNLRMHCILLATYSQLNFTDAPNILPMKLENPKVNTNTEPDCLVKPREIAISTKYHSCKLLVTFVKYLGHGSLARTIYLDIIGTIL